MTYNHIELTSEIKAVLIDLDGTLYNYEEAHQNALQLCNLSFLKDFPGALSAEEFYVKYREKRKNVALKLAPSGACRSRFLAFQELFEEIKIPQAFNKALKYEALYWDSLIDHMKLDKEAESFLNRCKEKNIRIAVVTDMQPHFQVQKLQKLKIDHLIDYLVTSEETGKEKPNSEIFLLAIAKLDLSINNVIMIGDDLEKDIKGAENLGIKAYQVNLNGN